MSEKILTLALFTLSFVLTSTLYSRLLVIGLESCFLNVCGLCCNIQYLTEFSCIVQTNGNSNSDSEISLFSDGTWSFLVKVYGLSFAVHSQSSLFVSCCCCFFFWCLFCANKEKVSFCNSLIFLWLDNFFVKLMVCVCSQSSRPSTL